MTKTMKRVLTIVLVGLLAISASVLGTFSVSKADAKSEAIAAFEEIVRIEVPAIEDINNEYLANADNLEKLSKAKAEYLFLQGLDALHEIDGALKAKWDGLQNKIGTVLTVYSEMKSLSVYLPVINANPEKISTSRRGDVGTLKISYDGIVEQYSLSVQQAIDQKIGWIYTDEYIQDGVDFFTKLNNLINDAYGNIEAAETAIKAIWSGIQDSEQKSETLGITLELVDLLQAAETAINNVVVDDHSKIENKDGIDGEYCYTYENAKRIIEGHIADALTLAGEIDALDRELKFKAPTDRPNDAVCYSREREINELNDNKFTKIGETEDGYMTYFKTTHPVQYDNLKAMLDHCAGVKTAIEKANALIDAIESVKYVPTEWEAAIVAAETAFAALDKDVKTDAYVDIQTLTDARDAYELMLQEIDKVVALIALIPADITLEDACYTAIDNARKGYNAYVALNEGYKANFPQAELDKIVAAEDAYAARENAVKEWIAEVVAFYSAFEGATPAKKIAQIWGANLDKIAELETAYGAFGADQQAYAATAKAELDAIKEIASVTNIKTMQDMIKALEPMANLGALQNAKNKYDTLHETQQELIDTTVLSILNAKWAKYQAVSYFDKAVAIIKANVEAKLYFEQDVTLMNTLFVLYNVLDEEGRAMVESYDDLVAIEIVLADAELINVYEYSNELATKIEQANNSIAQLKADLDALNAELSGKIDELNSALEKANSTATIAMVIAIIATVAAIAGIVLVFTKKN